MTKLTQETEDVAGLADDLRYIAAHEKDPRNEERIYAAADRLQSLSDRIDVLEGALEQAREALALGAAIPPVDHRNRDAVIALGECIGYGALMATASVEWRLRLGDLVGGEFCAGPCRSTAESVIAVIDRASLRTTHREAP